MTTPLTPERLAEIRERLNINRLGTQIYHEMDRDILAIRDLLAEVDRLWAAITAVRSVCMTTDGEYLEPEFEIPVGEALKMLAEKGVLDDQT